jgi:hypothetical protein
MRCTVETDRPQARDRPRELQCVASGGTLSNVRTTASIRASSMVRGARAGFIAQTVEAMLDKAPAPLADRSPIDLKPCRYRLILCALGASQHNPGTQR